MLERGAPDCPFLNLAIALLTIALSSTATLRTLDVTSERTWLIFLLTNIIGYVAGVVL